MSKASTSGAMSPGLLKALERARREPEGRFHGESHSDYGMVVIAGDPGRRVYFRCDAVPAEMTVPAAREMVGQPFLAGCRNPSAIHHGVQRLFAWLDQAAEEERLVGRAESRRRIIEAIAKEEPDNR